MKWRIYFVESTVDGETSDDAFAVSSVGAVILKQADDNPNNWRGYTLRRSFVFLCWEHIVLSGGVVLDEMRWGGKDDLFGLMDYYSTHKGPQKVLIGREIHDETYQEISRLAAKDGCLCDVPCEHKV